MIADGLEGGRSEPLPDIVGLQDDSHHHLEEEENESLESRACKFCYSEESIGEWLCPCKCSGSIKWVHASCFERWLRNAPLGQQTQCITCKLVFFAVHNIIVSKYAHSCTICFLI
ncbi:unnamed protein product [Toxocara canis]|uniref:RING-CH-type domain-containing protein n=1 Tax=Toxocara canis TaxID=6265 RepID=A0A183VAZ8_TOXCA|nr:unnamed protein product [Toxocara canis]